MDINNFQRVGAPSNTHAGHEFEEAAQRFWKSKGVELTPNFSVPIGFGEKKVHRFDLGSDEPAALIECKSYTWTAGGNSPSAKIRGMNEVMLYFSVTPSHYRKVLFVLKHMKGNLSLAEHYIRTQRHLIPDGIEIWEFDIETSQGNQVL